MEPAESFVDLGGRIVNQKLARRIIAGVAVVLVLAAIVPVVFQQKDDDQGADATTAARPAWQPENPAPDADAAPAWNGTQTQDDGRTEPRQTVVPESPPSLGYKEPAEPVHAPDLPNTGELAAGSLRRETPGNESAGPIHPEASEQAAAANRGQALAPSSDGVGPSDRADWSGVNPRDPAAGSTANRETAIDNADAQAGVYRDHHQPRRPEPPSQPGYRTGEPAGDYGTANWDGGRSAATADSREMQPYRNDSPPSYRHTDPNAVDPRGYAIQPARHAAGPPAYPSSANAHSGYAPPTADYRSAPTADYRSAPTADYRAAPTADYRAQPYPASYRDATPNTGASGYQHGSAYGHDPRAYQPAPGYYDGSGTRAAPGGAAPSYQADRRYDASAGYAPYRTQPNDARFHGTIEQPPVPTQHNSGSRLY